MNFFDIALGKKLGGGGEGPTLTNLNVLANGTYIVQEGYAWDEVTARCDIYEEKITAASPSQVIIPNFRTIVDNYYSRDQYIEFTFNSQATGFPIEIAQGTGNNYILFGGACDSAGNGAVLYAQGVFGTPGMSIVKALMIQNNSLIDITQYAQLGMSDIKITLSRVRNKTDD